MLLDFSCPEVGNYYKLHFIVQKKAYLLDTENNKWTASDGVWVFLIKYKNYVPMSIISIPSHFSR